MFEDAKRRASSLVAFLDLLGEALDQPAAIRAAALVPLSPRAVQAIANMAHLALSNLGVAAILAGRCAEEVVDELLADLQVP